MTQSSKPWDGILLGDASEAPYSSNEWAHIWNMLHGVGSVFPNYGIIPGTGDSSHAPLQVLETSAVSANVEIHVGAALVNGKLYENTATEALAVGANVSGNPRIDTVILRIDYTAQTTRLVIKQGTPAGSPVHPALTQSASIWEIPLADIAVANGFSTIVTANITDRRQYVRSTDSGWQPYVYGACHIPNAAYNANLVSMRQLAVPITVQGNMLIQDVTFISGALTNREIEWGIYVQNLNDGVAGNSIVKSLGGRYNSGVNSNMTVGNPITIQALPGPVVVAPGSYWFIIDFDGSYGMPTIIPTSLDAATNKILFNTVDAGLGQTVDLDVNFTASSRAVGIRLGGRVLDSLTGF